MRCEGEIRTARRHSKPCPRRATEGVGGLALCAPCAARVRDARVLELKARAAELARCPTCGCRPDGPRCTIAIDDTGSVGSCVPRGVLGLEVCSACLPRAA